MWRGQLKKFENLEIIHCRTWNLARKLKIMENEKHTLDDLKMTKSLKNVKNEKCTLRSEEHTSELQSPTHISYAVFCLKKKFF